MAANYKFKARQNEANGPLNESAAKGEVFFTAAKLLFAGISNAVRPFALVPRL